MSERPLRGLGELLLGEVMLLGHDNVVAAGEQELLQWPPRRGVSGADSEAVGGELRRISVDPWFDGLASVRMDASSVLSGLRKADQTAERDVASRTRISSFTNANASGRVPVHSIGDGTILEFKKYISNEPLPFVLLGKETAPSASSQASSLA